MGRSLDENAAMLIDVVGEYYGVAAWKIVGRDKHLSVARVRQLCIYLSHKLTIKSNREIGEMFCRDHSTVTHAIQCVKERIESDEMWRLQVEHLHRTLRPLFIRDCS
jgi:chromosomal replication initiator protein